MTTIDSFEFPDDLYYAVDHIWTRVEGDVATIGVTQFGQDLAGDIVYVELPRVGRDVTKDEPFMSMESGKWVGRVKAMVSGKIAESNEEIEWESTVINEDPYGGGWLVKIEAADLSELDGLLRPTDPTFAELIAAEREKYDM